MLALSEIITLSQHYNMINIVIISNDINLEIIVHQNAPFGELNQKVNFGISLDNIEKLAKCLNEIIKGRQYVVIMDYNPQ